MAGGGGTSMAMGGVSPPLSWVLLVPVFEVSTLEPRAVAWAAARVAARAEGEKAVRAVEGAAAGAATGAATGAVAAEEVPAG